MRARSLAHDLHEIPADMAHTGEEHEEPAAEQQQALEQIGPRNRRQSAIDRISPRRHRDDRNRPVSVDAPQCFHGEAGGVEDGGKHGEHVARDDQTRVQRSRSWPIAALQVLGHCRDTVAQVDRDEYPQQNGERRRNHPFPVEDRHSPLVREAVFGDQVHRVYSGRDDREPDRKPGQPVARPEVVVDGSLLSSTDGKADPEHDHHIAEEEEEVDAAECASIYVHCRSPIE